MSRGLRVQIVLTVVGVIATVVLSRLNLVTPTVIAALVTMGAVGSAAFDALSAWFERRDLERRAREAAARTPQETARLREQARREYEERSDGQARS